MPANPSPAEIRTAREAAGPTVRELQALGDVHAGMCSSWEFCEL